MHVLTSLVTHSQAFCLQLRDNEGFFFLQKAYKSVVNVTTHKEANKITVNVWNARKSRLEMNKKNPITVSVFIKSSNHFSKRGL